jgi:phosphoribosyl 1,2-cyclic phosphate phosphodiesterase
VEAREKGVPYERSGPSAFLHDEHILIDTPAESAIQLNRCGVGQVRHLLFTHLDPDHVEGFRVVEQIALDFRTWRAYPHKQINLVIPQSLAMRLKDIRSAYGPLAAYYEDQGFMRTSPFKGSVRIGDLEIKAIPVEREPEGAYVYVFLGGGKKLIYAPCDIRPFPEERPEVQQADLLVIQPGIFEQGLKHGFTYPETHVSRTTLYTFEQTLDLARRIGAAQILFTHLEEYWNRSHDDYVALESRWPQVRFAYDGMGVTI